MSNIQQKGFTLIELMIVVVIIGILAMIAYPSYQESVTKTRRTDGKGLLLEVMSGQERYYTRNNTYSTDLTDLGYAAATNIDSENGFYKVSAAACGGSTISDCVILTATAQGAQATDGNLTLDSRNTKLPANKW